MKRYELINYLISTYGYRDYLEIGVRKPKLCFNLVKCANKVGVDPDPQPSCTYPITSDEFFEKYPDFRFDIVFVDGMHECDYVLRDVNNSLRILRPGGVIVLHDCNPTSEFKQRTYAEYRRRPGPWNGTVWRAMVEFRRRSDLLVYTVDTDEGLGIIRPGFQVPIDLRDSPVNYRTLSLLRAYILNLVTVGTFFEVEQAYARSAAAPAVSGGHSGDDGITAGHLQGAGVSGSSMQ